MFMDDDHGVALATDIRDRGRPARPRWGTVLAGIGAAAMFGIVHTGSTAAQDSTEAEMGRALMQMRETTESPGAAPLAAGEGWYTCDVGMVGPGWGNIYLHLGCGAAITPRWFIARADQARDMLAAGLTAISTGKKMIVYLTGSDAYSEIKASYVTN
jgi:hypothetical protein